MQDKIYEMQLSINIKENEFNYQKLLLKKLNNLLLKVDDFINANKINLESTKKIYEIDPYLIWYVHYYNVTPASIQFSIDEEDFKPSNMEREITTQDEFEKFESALISANENLFKLKESIEIQIKTEKEKLIQINKEKVELNDNLYIYLFYPEEIEFSQIMKALRSNEKTQPFTPNRKYQLEMFKYYYNLTENEKDTQEIAADKTLKKFFGSNYESQKKANLDSFIKTARLMRSRIETFK